MMLINIVIRANISHKLVLKKILHMEINNMEIKNMWSQNSDKKDFLNIN